MAHRIAPFRRFQFRFGLGISLCGLLCGCGTARSTVKLAPSSQARAVIASPENPKAELDNTSEIQGVAYSEVAAGEPLPDPQPTGWSLGTFESLALSNNPAIQQATASASKAVGYRNQVGRKPNPVVGYNATQLALQRTFVVYPGAQRGSWSMG